MTIIRTTAIAALLTLFFTVTFSYAAPSCCDPNSNAAVSGNSFLQQTSTGRIVPVAPVGTGNVNPGVSQASAALRAVRPDGAQPVGCCPAGGPRPQAYSPAGPGCCPGPNGPGSVQAGSYVGPAQAPVPGCGGGCCGGGANSRVFPGYQTARPIGQFTSAPAQPVRANAQVNQGFYSRPAGAYTGQGFGRPGYFGSGKPVLNSLY